MARQLREGVRSHDIVCRYGGEEFALILPGTDGAQAMIVAETSAPGDREQQGLADGQVTISIGVASPQDVPSTMSASCSAPPTRRFTRPRPTAAIAWCVSGAWRNQGAGR